jgi:glycerophosphoryl diester phosphodiesterase
VRTKKVQHLHQFHGPPRIVAHRGARGLCDTENTVESFQKAQDVGAPWIEFDVRRTGDGELVCFHDESIEGAALASLGYPELLAATRRAGFDAPRVEDVFRRFRGDLKFDIELKEAGYEADLCRLANLYLDASDFVMKSFVDEAVAAIKRADPTIRAGLLLGVDGPKYDPRIRLPEILPYKRLLKLRADFVAPNEALCRLNYVKRMHGLGLEVWVWTVNDRARMEQLVDQGVDAIITDYPDVGLDVVSGWS